MFRDIAFGHISDTLLAVTPVADPRSSDRIFGQKAASPEWHHRRALGAPASRQLRPRKLTVN
jgi:hypothetical protein